MYTSMRTDSVRFVPRIIDRPVDLRYRLSSRGPSFEPLSSLEMSDPTGYEPRDGPPSVQRGPAWIERESQKNVRSDTCDTHHLQADKAMD